jgi:AhpD family alkylhydroperoxidase
MNHPPAQRVEIKKIAPGVSAAMGGLHAAAVGAAERAGIEPGLLELVRLLASRINGCSFCLDLHGRDARAGGESDERIEAVTEWRTSPLYTERERAALALTEAITLVSTSEVPDDVYRRAAAAFDDEQLAALIWAATVINAYNRIAVTTRMTSPAPQPA